MPFPPGFLDELRTRLPLSVIAAKKLRLLRAGREFKACCPFHKEKTPSFYINDDKQFYHCFGCGAHGDVITFTMRMDNLSFPEAVESLAAQAGLVVPKDTPKEREKYSREKRLYLLLEKAASWFEEQLFASAGRDALLYMHSRGISNEALRRFHIGYAPQDAQALIRHLESEGFSTEEMAEVGLVKKAEGRDEFFSFFRNRIIFPVGDKRGRIVAFGGRILGDGEPKYLNSPDHPLFHKGKMLYGLSRARTAIHQNQPLILVEGYMDVVALVEAGFSGAMAPLGTALTEQQLLLLWELIPPLDVRDPSRDYSPIICFDGDSAGKRAAIRAIDRALPFLSAERTLRFAWLPENEDPDSLLSKTGRPGMQAVFDQAKPMIDAIWEICLEGRNLRTPEERQSFIRSINQKISLIKDEVLRTLYKEELGKRLAEIFRWRPKSVTAFQQNRAYRFIKKEKFSFPETPTARRKPPKSAFLRERVLLALMINHPALFAEFGEDLAKTSFSDEALEALRQEIVNILSSDSHETLDAAELYRHLSSEEAGKKLRTGLGKVLSADTYMHASYARPECNLERARKGWKSIWNKYLQELLQLDLQMAKRRYAEDASDANLARIMALRAQIEAFLHDPEVNGQIEDDSLASA